MRHTHCTVHAIGLNEDILFQKKNTFSICTIILFFKEIADFYSVFVLFFVFILKILKPTLSKLHILS